MRSYIKKKCINRNQRGDLSLGVHVPIAIMRHIRQALERDQEMSDTQIFILNYRGRVHLTGEVHSLYQAQKALLTAIRQPGVKEVINNLHVAE